MLILTLAIIQIKASAAGQNVYIYNSTDCDISVDLIAACPDENPCVEYSCSCSYYVPAHSSLINPPGIAAFFPSPTCGSNWEWFKADVGISCLYHHEQFEFGGGNIYNYCLTPPRDAEFDPANVPPHNPPDVCCTSVPIKMDMIYSVTGVTINIHY